MLALALAALVTLPPQQTSGIPQRYRGPVVRLKPYPQLVSDRWSVVGSLPQGNTEVRAAGARVFAVSAAGAAEFSGGGWKPTGLDSVPAGAVVDGLPSGVRALSAAKARSGETWAVTTQGALRGKPGSWKPLDLPTQYKHGQPTPHIDLVVRAIARDNQGHLWLATSEGAYATDGDNWWEGFSGSDGMPYEDMTCVTIARNGDVWGGTTEGAWRLRNGQWRYFWGKRWLPENRVNSIAEDAEGGIWIGTDGGVSRIRERTISLAEKAAHYEEITAKRHNRRGWVASSGLLVPGDPEKGHRFHATDNDGLWTAMYLAGEAFRFAVTNDPEAKTLVSKSLKALLDLERLSGFAGCPARAILNKGEDASGYDAEETVRVEGEPDKIWYTPKEHPNLLVKGDCSSDELDGHYFAWYVVHELAATEAERREIRDVCKAVTDNLLRNQYTLVGHTGRKTRWGVFGPQFLNDDPRWEEERGLNSSELLCYLKVAERIVGDPRYTKASNDLIENHHYLLNTLQYRRGKTWNRVNHSDDELAFLVYYPILQLENDPHRRAILARTMSAAWSGIRPERSPLYNFMFGASTGEACAAEEGLETLQDWPWELIEWTVRNSHRTDVELRVAKGRNRTQITRVLPVSERGTHRWNGDPYAPDYGGEGRTEEDGAAFLLPYWMGRYHGVLQE